MPTDKKIEEVRVRITCDGDVVLARQRARQLATQLGFPPGDLAIIATSVSELVRNILSYAKQGEIALRAVHQGPKRGIEVVARDQGPGIPDIAQAMQDGFSTSGGLGLGLPGVRRLMDDFQIESVVGRGTTVAVKKWLRPHA